jgi:high-affinity iron transporter
MTPHSHIDARATDLQPGAMFNAALIAAASVLVIALLYQALTSGGTPDPLRVEAGASRIVDISVLVFREGLEFVLVLAAITANMTGRRNHYRKPVVTGAALATVATMFTWLAAVAILDNLAENVSALHIQAATGLLAVIVLVVVMNWFFHKVYWTGWISMHSKRKQEILLGAENESASSWRVWWGLALLGFTSLYREGFEIVLFLQSYRLKLGGAPVLQGVSIGLFFTALVGLITFGLRRHLPYRRMLVVTGILLGLVLLVMVGEQAQEMQLASWIPTTPVPSLERAIPSWMGLWFAVFPTVETLLAQVIAGTIVIGSYLIAENGVTRSA